MNKNSIILVGIVLMAIVIVVIVQAIVVINLVPAPASTSSTVPPPTATTGITTNLWEGYIKHSIGAIGAVVVALIAGTFAYFRLIRQLQITTRNVFLDMLIGNNTYRNQLDSFLNALISENFDDIDKRVKELPAIFYLFVLKPHLRESLKDAIEKKDISRTIELTKQLFTA